jgi:hypothetical protein
MRRQEHHAGGRCDTREEMAARLAWWQKTGRWPGPDEEGGEDDA